jgi:hypothetical protein
MSSFEDLMKATAQLGDAIVDPREWPTVMDGMSHAVHAEGAILLQSGVQTPDVPRTEAIREFADDYFNGGWHLGEVRAVRCVPLLQHGQPVAIDQDILSPDEMRRNTTYNEFYIPNSFQWFAVVGFRAGTSLWGMSFQRTIRQGPFERTDQRILAQISRRLSEAATLPQVISRAVLTGTMNALNLVQQPAAVLDRLGSVIDTNAAADQLFDSEIRVHNRRLYVADQHARAEPERLADALRAAGDTAPLPTDPIVVRPGSSRLS